MEFEVMLQKIGSRIHAEMNKKSPRWKINKLAAESNVDEKVISRLIHFEKSNPGLKTLDKIATALGLTLEDLCDSTGKK